MSRPALAPALALLLSVLPACGPKEPPPPTRDEVKALLSKEADAIKRDGEKGPDLGVKSVWNVEAVDMVEQPGNAPNPWRGSVRMLIVTRNQGVGEVQEDRIAKTFDFVYDAAGKRWLMEYKPK